MILGVGCALGLGVAAAASAAPIYSFKHYGVEQGLTSLSIEAITQDRQGFLWVGTQDGLFRYDGHAFRRFGRDEGLPSSFVFRVLEAGGTLWAGTRAGLIRRSGDRFVHVRLEGTEADPQIDVLEAGCDGSLLVGWVRGGFRIDKLGRATPLLPTGDLPAITALRSDCMAGRLWIGAGRELSMWDGRELRRLGPADGLADLGPIAGIAVAPEGTVWVRTKDRLYRRGVRETRFRSSDIGLPRAREAKSLLVGRDGQLWVTTDVGLARWRPAGFEVLGKRHGLASDAAKVVYEDREGSLWIGNDAAGLDRWLGRGVFSAYTTAQGLSHDVVWAAERDRRGQLWIGTQHGLDRLLSDGTWAPRPADPRLARAYVLALADGPGGVWAGTFGDGLLLVARDARTARRFGKDAGVENVAALLLDRSGGLWVATDDGLFRGDGRGNSSDFVRVPLPSHQRDANGQPRREVIFGLLEDSKGRVWAAGRFGLAYLSGGRWTRLTRKDGLEDDFTSAVEEDADGSVWIAYRDRPGLSRLRFDAGRPRIERVAAQQGLQAETITLLARDGRGRLWVGSTNGIDVLEDGRFRHVGRADGMRTTDTCQNAVFAEAHGPVWVGTPEGLLRVDLPLRPGRADLPVVVTAATLDGFPVDGADARQRVPPTAFEAAFSALSFAHEESTRFRYRLEGYEQDEIETDQRRIRYPRLPAGEYVFRVRAVVPGLETAAPPTAIGFRLAPPWWQTPWARGGLAVAVVGLLAAAERARHALLRRRNRLLERLVAEQTRELAEASLNDPLTGLRNRRFFDQVMPADVQRALRRKPGDRGELVFCLLDLDHFKRINDTRGHHAGDAVLVETARRLRSALREADLLVRWGGEEFMVVLRDTDREQGQALAERLLEALRSRPVACSGVSLCITASLGWAPFPFFRPEPAAYALKDVLVLADKALYMAKEEGRDRGVGLVPLVPSPVASRPHPDEQWEAAKSLVHAVWSLAH